MFIVLRERSAVILGRSLKPLSMMSHNTFPFEKAVVRFVTSRQKPGTVAVNTLPKTGKMVYNIDTYMDFHVVSDEN
ncbi:hypothetical protein QJ036_12215 [Ruminococcus sp. YH-rum2234]|uniref:Uncharacterized protein n=1 Tax=Fusibacillus kribbianus TaxID=3044208 RepID=A0AAP4BC79_9FIRM|nr:hypothetical protein [Ruminococcus sp. YH-rum2234]